MKRTIKFALAATAFHVSMCVTIAHAAPGDIRNLGDFGGVRSDGFGINNAGQVTGYFETDLPEDAAYRYDLNAGPAPLNLGNFGSKYSVGYDINASGQIVGDSFISNTEIRHAFRYDGTPGAGGIMRDLGTIGPRDSYAYGINSGGQVTGAFDSNDLSFNIHAFVYSGTPGSGGTMLDLGTLPGGTSSIGRSINSAGHIVGEATGFPAFAFHAFLYRGIPGAGGAMVDLGTLGGTNSAAEDINDAGQIAGFSYMPGDETLHAFRYSGAPGAGGVMVDLGVPAGMSDSTGYSIDAHGNIVGFAATPADVRHATLWPMDGVAIDLDAWLDMTNPASGAFWTLKYAYGINDNGLVTGEGFYDDGPDGLTDGIRAYVLDASSLKAVPEPGALSTLVLAAASLLGRRRRRERSRVRVARWRIPMSTRLAAVRGGILPPLAALLIASLAADARAEWTYANLHPAGAQNNSALFGVADGQQVGYVGRNADGLPTPAVWAARPLHTSASIRLVLLGSHTGRHKGGKWARSYSTGMSTPSSGAAPINHTSTSNRPGRTSRRRWASAAHSKSDTWFWNRLFRMCTTPACGAAALRHG